MEWGQWAEDVVWGQWAGIWYGDNGSEARHSFLENVIKKKFSGQFPRQHLSRGWISSLVMKDG